MAKKKVNFQLIPTDDGAYDLLSMARETWHSELSQARIAMAWRKDTKADKDGHLVLGRCVKVTDLHKEFSGYDFIIVLNREVWSMERFTDDKRLALLDHELCHAAVSEDADAEPRYDERGRPVFRIRKHDIEEFQSVVAHHGSYKEDLVSFARTLLEEKRAPLLVDNSERTKRGVETAEARKARCEAIGNQAQTGKAAPKAGRVTGIGAVQ